jgi:3'(2'), 5'-bisphosphate nucleotidase
MLVTGHAVDLRGVPLTDELLRVYHNFNPKVPACYASQFQKTIIMSYAKELEIACLAVQRAARLTKSILASVDKGALDKQDNTPVTIADFAAQALIISALHHVFPADQFVGEESSGALRENPQLLDRVWEVVSTTKLDDVDGEEKGIVLATPSSPDEMLNLIDLGGKGAGGPEGRIWVLDPVDGTATFIKGQQYAVCLALLEDGQQKVGVLGCPNLKLESDLQRTRVQENVVDSAGAGQMLSAVLGQGAYIQPLSNTTRLLEGQRQRLPTRQPTDPSNVRFVDCAYADSTDYNKHGLVATALGAPWPATADLWSSQMRYVALAVGECNTLIKIVRQQDHRSSIWDHAGGMLIAQEVGCTITDVRGDPVSCGQGRKLAGAYGLVVAPAPVHASVLEAVKEVIQRS